MNQASENTSATQEELYVKAMDLYTHFINERQILQIRDIFQELGNYKDSAKYLAKCETFIAYRTGNKISFGNYHGKELIWKVIRTDANRCLLLAEKPVEYMYFHPERVEITWNSCALRRWLNRQFLEEAFTLQERMMILLSPHKNNTDPRWADENGPDTRDKAFIFNLMELNEYLPNIEDRAIQEWWWLRGHGCSNLNQQVVYVDGSIYENGVSSNSKEMGVRPAMWIRLSK